MTHILIADDHPLFRLALTQALRAIAPDATLIEADSLAAACAQLDARHDIDLVLLDLHLPDSRGLMGLASLRAEHPAVAVAMISANEDPMVIRRALAFGAAGYIPKGASLDELATALRAVLNCEEYVPAQLHNAIGTSATSREDQQVAARLASLTPQQFRVLSQVADGLLNKQIADKLGIQERTIKAHLSLIFQKLGVRNRTQASVMLRSLELGDPTRIAIVDDDGEI
ncbi:MAG TPA: response regulator transcription factor [Pseudomonadota bacterium]|nr:response regulator transcription factor [Rhodanobacteraceae bacterium]MBP9155125.1 response regulator transcription factor [Xanthomonadales bacterium]HQW80754.1 response regulator transcription factor [Pseudomonadota bacterium]